ncbi:MAG: tRNA dihydrouridine synthase DusB [Clostridiales bacterium]|nr:tRNA dihydrouridine synthase DusB [Clostridiales bacterium]
MYKSPFYIGNTKLKNNIFLAPMAGVTDLAFRIICKEQGCGLTYSEMISAKGVHYKSKGSIELAATDVAEGPVAVQIFGREPGLMAEAAAIFENTGAAIIDINAGCPVAKVVANGEGAALMREPLLLGEIIAQTVRAVHVPVTVKIRRGWDESQENAVAVASIAEANGASAIAVHGRFRSQFYSGRSDRSVIANVKKNVKIPVIGNGDVFSYSDAKILFEETGCDGIMVARGAEGNPWIFTEILTGGAEKKSYSETVDMIIRHLELAVKYKGEYTAAKEMRKHIAWYLKGYRNSAVIRDRVFKALTKAQLIDILEEYRND